MNLNQSPISFAEILDAASAPTEDGGLCIEKIFIKKAPKTPKKKVKR